MVYVSFFAWLPGSMHSNIGTVLGARPWVAWPPGSWHSNTVTVVLLLFCAWPRVAGNRQTLQVQFKGENCCLCLNFSFNPTQNPGVFVHFLVIFFVSWCFFSAPDCALAGVCFVLLIVLLLVLFCAADCAFAGALFCVLLIVLLLLLFCAPDCAFAGAFFVLLSVFFLVLFFSFPGFFLCSCLCFDWCFFIFCISWCLCTTKFEQTPGDFPGAPDCAFAGAFLCAPDCAFAGAFFVLLLVLFLVLFCYFLVHFLRS